MLSGNLLARGLAQHCRRRFKSSAMLIDVDCNLWHKDMPRLCFNDEASESMRTPFSILDYDDMSRIRGILTPSSTLAEAREGLKSLSTYDGRIAMKTTVGVHPFHVNDADQLPIEQFIEEAKALIAMDTSGYIAAIGECGIDASDDFPPIEDQIPWFKAQIELAESLRMPLFVHDRLAPATTLYLLEGVTVPVIVHCFTGNIEDCQEYVNQGFSISISGFIFREDAQRIRDCVRDGIIPLDKLMIETDAPYMGFPGCREYYLNKNSDYIAKLNSKQRKGIGSSQYPNPPSSLQSVFLHVLFHLNKGREKRGEAPLSEEAFAKITTSNANHFFGFNLEE
jgi:TatD DNase family protein